MKYLFRPAPENDVETNTFVRTRSKRIKTMLDKAVEFMTNTKDPGHGINHLNHVVRNANRFFRFMGDTLDIDKEVLLLALYWHDVWKSQHKPTARDYLFHQLYEGWGSMIMFRKQASVTDLPPRLTRAVSYAIRKHSAVQFRPAKTLEAQLLWDIDTLDIWNSQRTELIFKNLEWTNISVFDSYILYLEKIGFHLNFEWTKNEVKKIRPLFFKEMSKFRELLVKGKVSKSPQPLFEQSKALPAKRNMDNNS